MDITGHLWCTQGVDFPSLLKGRDILPIPTIPTTPSPTSDNVTPTCGNSNQKKKKRLMIDVDTKS